MRSLSWLDSAVDCSGDDDASGFDEDGDCGDDDGDVVVVACCDDAMRALHLI